jgi:hypothetical protein
MILKGQQRMVPKVDLGEWAIALLGTGTCPCRKAANVNVNHHLLVEYYTLKPSAEIDLVLKPVSRSLSQWQSGSRLK